MSMHRAVAGTIMTRIQVTLLTILQSVAFTRLLGIEGRGLYAKLQASLNLGVLLFSFGIAAALSNYIANKKVSSRDAIGLAFWVWLTGSTLMLGLIVVFHQYPTSDLIFPLKYRAMFFVLYFYVSFVLTTLQLSLAAALLGKAEFAAGNWLELLTTTLRTLIFATIFFFGTRVPLDLLIGLDLALVVIKTAAYFAVYATNFELKFNLRLRDLRAALGMLGFSFWIYAAGVVSFLYLRIDYWLVENTLGLKELGIYSVASGLAQYMTIVPIALGSVMVPTLAALRADERAETLKYFSRLNITATALGTIALSLLAHPVIVILYGEEFGGAATALKILAPSFFFVSIKFLFTNYNAVAGNQKRNVLAEILGLGVGLSLNLILLPRIGILGACWASLGANFCACVYISLFVLWDNRRGLIVVRRADLQALWSTLFSPPDKEIA